MLSAKIISISALCFLPSLVLVQYATMFFEVTYDPAYFLNIISTECMRFFKYLGEWAAYLSSYLTFIKLGDILKAFSDVMNPMLKLIFSPFQFIYGYVSFASLYEHPILVTIGSILIVFIILYIMYRKNIFKLRDLVVQMTTQNAQNYAEGFPYENGNESSDDEEQDGTKMD